MPKFNYAETERTRDNKPVCARTKPVSRPDMIENSDGGYVFELTPLKMLERFLILGSESPTYYASAVDLTKRNCSNLKVCIQQFPKETLETLLDFSLNNRVPKQQPLIFALSLFWKYGAPDSKYEASLAACQMLRTFTHLATFFNFIKQFHSISPSVGRVARKWYTEKDAEQVYFQYTKYSKREGWSHKDILHLCHIKPTTKGLAELMNHIFGKSCDHRLAKYFPAHKADIALRTAPTLTAILTILSKNKVQWEQIPTQWLKEPKVWESILPYMGLTAMIRSLGRMSSTGLFRGMNEPVKTVVNRLRDTEALKKARVHPIQLLSAYFVYKQGRAAKGNTAWPVNAKIKEALSDAFMKSFDFAEPTGKNFMIGVDTSGSMTWGNICGVPGLTPMDAAACIAKERLHAEEWTEVYGFSSTLRKINITKRDSIEATIRKVNIGDVSSTNPALLMQYATKHELPVDVFIMITDCEVNHGNHPFMELKKYRRVTGRDAKLIVIGMTATNCTLADPSDGGMLDIVGFDTAAPTVIHEFVTGGI